MMPFTASVPPLFARSVLKYARNACRQRRRVRLRCATSGIRQVCSGSRSFSARRRPSVVSLALAQDGLDAEQGVAPTAVVPGGGLLDPPADLIDDPGAELDHVEGVLHRGGVGQLADQGGLVAAGRGTARSTGAAAARLGAHRARRAAVARRYRSSGTSTPQDRTTLIREPSPPTRCPKSRENLRWLQGWDGRAHTTHGFCSGWAAPPAVRAPTKAGGAQRS